jgi:D-glycero-D-manno-heptose 1,7-bisphosphate phosphatase
VTREDGAARPGAVFLDLGGTLLALDGEGVVAQDAGGHPRVLPGVATRLAALAGERVFVVTNQACLADGTLTPEEFQRFCDAVRAAAGDVVTAYLVCAHPRDAGCGCRKPAPGLVLGAARMHGLDLAASVLVGDTDVDRELAVRAGVGRFVPAADYFGADDFGGDFGADR